MVFFLFFFVVVDVWLVVCLFFPVRSWHLPFPGPAEFARFLLAGTFAERLLPARGSATRTAKGVTVRAALPVSDLGVMGHGDYSTVTMRFEERGTVRITASSWPSLQVVRGALALRMASLLPAAKRVIDAPRPSHAASRAGASELKLKRARNLLDALDAFQQDSTAAGQDDPRALLRLGERASSISGEIFATYGSCREM